jgi:hypothetical protein
VQHVKLRAQDFGSFAPSGSVKKKRKVGASSIVFGIITKWSMMAFAPLHYFSSLYLAVFVLKHANVVPPLLFERD